MSILKANVLIFLNKALRRTETDIDIYIQTCLNDLANSNLLLGQDTDQALESGDLTLDYPTDFKKLNTITLINDSSVRDKPLRKLPGGHRQYLKLRESDSATGTPEWFSEYNKKFHLWRPANGDYTTEIEYFRHHPQDVSDILFGDEFINAVNFGTTFWFATMTNLKEYEDKWGPIYSNERLMREASMEIQPSI